MKKITVQEFVTFGLIFLTIMFIGVYLFTSDRQGLEVSSTSTQTNVAPLSYEQGVIEASASSETETEEVDGTD